jgi:hypothetical protein
MMRSAVTEDKALLGSNLSAGDGPKLAGVETSPPVRLSSRDKPRLMLYTIEEHKHRFAAWAASSAASVNKNCRFSVEDGKRILEAVGMNRLIDSPDLLPSPENIDDEHRGWRGAVIAAARTHEIAFTHGVAAKLINIYLKAGFVCGGHHLHDRVRTLHPPIDRALLKELSLRNFGGARRFWNESMNIGWSNFDSDQYEIVIKTIRIAMGGSPLWEIEQHWRGYQG